MDRQKELADHFQRFRNNIIGQDLVFTTPYGRKKLLYADWIASGRLYRPIEEQIMNIFGPYVGNTHTETTETGTLMTKAYHLAQKKIKDHVHASSSDVVITSGFGMTGVINKFQRILGLRGCGHLTGKDCQDNRIHPVVFLTHMEHHSNHTSWFETATEIVQLQPDKELLVDLDELRRNLKKYSDRPMKIASVTACSNVTGIETPYYEIAKIMHEHGGYIFVDFAASAPYVDIDMHPGDPLKRLDAIFFSPHKFLGGPGSSGVLVFTSSLYDNPVPDQPGGGTVDWTNPWGEYKYVDDIEAREDGGTPGFLQAIKTALAIELKDQMGTQKMQEREAWLVKKAFDGLDKIPGIHVLANNIRERLGVISFYLDGLHYNLVVKLLNDLFGIQVRGGCACAGTYGHFLLDVSYEHSHEITQRISHGDLSVKPGWVRLSLHPTMTDSELDIILEAIHYIALHGSDYAGDYVYNKLNNEFRHKSEPEDKTVLVKGWFDVPYPCTPPLLAGEGTGEG
jgi:selenocysteine lyase/cysteine desulfurase